MNASLKKISRKLRLNSTDAEKKLWRHLQRKQLNGLKFRRQYPIDNFIVDFVCLERRLILEVDGGQHADNPNDKRRDEILEAKGFLILRFWNNEVLQNVEGVLGVIIETVTPHPQPSPSGEGVL